VVVAFSVVLDDSPSFDFDASDESLLSLHAASTSANTTSTAAMAEQRRNQPGRESEPRSERSEDGTSD
jgi:hypothetical protein